jgi:GH15 family glucan-1,4-alpha-glucosidase
VTDHGLDLAVIGNGRTAALVDPSARIVWWCFPRFDGDPVFCRLLAGEEEKGFADVVLDGCVEIKSEYGRNTPIVTAVMRDAQGAAVRVTDFAPRFYQFGRTFRPPQIIRIVEPIAGLPRVTIRIRPTHHYGQPTQHAMGSNHIRYSGGSTALRVTTDAPLSYIDREAAFVLTHPLHMVLGPDTPIDGDLATVCREFLDRTRDYWQEWVRRLAVSYDWQEATIRAAITLKLSNFEETGAIIAAHTTSIPEAPGSGRTWDYRYCWLRDAYFVVRALNRIGATRTMEDFISYILTIVLGRSEKLRPVYSVVPSDPMEERIEPGLLGYHGDGRHAGSARYLWQHHSGGLTDVLRSPFATDGRCRSVQADRASWRKGGAIRSGAGFRDLGVSRAKTHSYAFGGDVLGRLPAAGGDRGRAWAFRSRQGLGRDCGSPAVRNSVANLEPAPAGIYRGGWQR